MSHSDYRGNFLKKNLRNQNIENTDSEGRVGFRKHFHHYIGGYMEFYIGVREGCTKKKPEKMWSFAKLGGGGVSDGSKMPNLYFGKVFFQLACRIILGPPKHVLHLV